jgi:hypothetical protein
MQSETRKPRRLMFVHFPSAHKSTNGFNREQAAVVMCTYLTPIILPYNMT